MTQKANRSACINSGSSPSSIATKGSSWKSFLCSVFGSANCWHSSCSPRAFNRDVVSEEFQDSSTFGLSSCYSVFVVRLAIMVLLAILIGMLTLLTWHFTKIYTARSLDTLAYGLRYEMLQRPILRMWHVLNSTVEITTAQVKLSESIIRRYCKPVNQAQQVEMYELMRDLTWALFASRRALSSITINYKNGFVQAFHRDQRNNNTYYIYSDLFNYSISGSYHATVRSFNEGWSDQSIHNNISAVWYQEPLDPETGERLGKPWPIPPEELINIAGMSQVPDGTASWHVAVSKYTDSPLLSAALPVWDSSNGSIVAVVGVTTSFYSVGQLMKELVEFHSGHIYLTSQEGWLLATSTKAPLLTNSSTGPKLMMAIDSEDHVIRSGAEYLRKTDDTGSPTSHEVHIENARLGRQPYYIDSFFLNLKRLPMVGVVIIPRKYIMGRVDERALKTLVVLIAASICILVIGCVCIFILTNGVSKEMQLRAELISHLDARRKAEASSNYKSQFLANMSHELRTPMAAVIGLLDILICDECLSNDQYATVMQIRKCSTALLRLLNNILDLSKVESGKLVLEETQFDLGRELEGLFDMFSVQCINHDVETILDISDDMPKVVQGDSARIVQIFANLISNSIKFTSYGYIILRSWCEYPNSSTGTWQCLPCRKVHWPRLKCNPNQQEDHDNSCFRKENKMVLWFEVDDSGCGIDPSKWESVFESFEQADTSTTRLHGGTGLGLCIVRTLVNKMGGEIKVVMKDEPGTLMRLYLLLKTPANLEASEQHNQFKFEDYKLTVLLALNGRMGRLVISQWLQKNGVCTYEASEWNGLVQILQEHFQSENYARGLPSEFSESEERHETGMSSTLFIIVIDLELLDLSTDIWKEQLSYLDEYLGSSKFAWVLNHDTSNAIKSELRKRGHLMMINKPLYKAKIFQIFEAAVKDQNRELQQYVNTSKAAVVGDLNECQDIDDLPSCSTSSDDFEKLDLDIRRSAAPRHPKGKRSEQFSQAFPSQNQALNNRFVELPPANFAESTCSMKNLAQMRDIEEYQCGTFPTEQETLCASTIVPEPKSLQGLRILLAEDTPVLQRVATTMLEKLGAEVVAVGDGLQVVNTLNVMAQSKEPKMTSLVPKRDDDPETNHTAGMLPYDLILMDCQMPKMDGYEATKAIRKWESESGLHIPIVALTAHAMSSDEAKCLEVGMDAYLTKPIDRSLMVSTILSLTKITA